MRTRRGWLADVLLLMWPLATPAWAQEKPKAQKNPKEVSSPQLPATSPLDASYLIAPEDVLAIDVWKEAEITRTVPVRPDGKISLPLIGEMAASGKTPTELKNEIAQKLKQFVAEPTVTVVVKEVNSPKVSVIGEVKNPNMYKIKDKTTLLDAIALAGGLTEYSKKKVVISRVGPNGDTQFIRLNIDDVMKGKKPDPFYILPYDKIVIQ